MDFAHAAHTVAEIVLPRRTSPIVGMLDQVLRWGVRLLLAFVPVVISPWTFELIEFSKQAVLLGMSVILMAVWLARSVIAREVRSAVSPLNWAVLAFLAITAAATAFSVDWITSSFGFYGRFNGGLSSVVAYIATYFLVLQVASDEREVKGLVGSWLIGVGIGALVLLLQVLGLRMLPIDAASSPVFNTLSRSLNAVVLALAATFPLALVFAREARTAMARGAALALTAVVPILAFIIDYQLGWISLILAAVLWLAVVFWKNESVGLTWTLLPALALLLAVVGWPVRAPAFTQVKVPVEVNLSFKASWQVASQSVRANPLLGTGPETFIYGFSKYKPESFNDSDFWAFRFDKAASEFAQAFATTGILGLATYLLMVLTALFLAWRVLRDREQPDWYIRAAVVISFLVLLVGQVFYFSNTTTALGWWMVLGLLAALSSKRQRELSLADSPRTSFAFSFGVAVGVLLAIGVCFGLVRAVAADVAYAHAQQAVQDSKLEEAETSLTYAVRMNPLRDVYYISLAQVRLAIANRDAARPLAATEAEKKTQVENLQRYLRSSIEAALAATSLGRENVANWEALGSIYRGTVLYAQDAERWVIDSFQNAIKREPRNPALYTELGKAFLIASSRNRQALNQAKPEDKEKIEKQAGQYTEQAMGYFDQAIKLKANYTPAHFNYALALEQQGKLDEAIDKLESVRQYNPQDIDVLYELGSLYFGKARYPQAEAAFSTITDLVPNHASAHYGLGLTYDKLGKRDEAIVQLQRVLDLTPDSNPNYNTLMQQLEALKRGESPSTATPPADQP